MTLRLVRTVDSAEIAQTRRRDLDIPHDRAATIAGETLEAMRSGTYRTAGGTTVGWGRLVDAARARKISIEPAAALPRRRPASFDETTVAVDNVTSLDAARAMREDGRRPLVLNFANGIEPGGGFLVGARAQEEALCRASALYATLEGDPMYAAHRKLRFGNDPARTAEDFRQELEESFAGRFHEVVFAICDWSQERRFLRPFQEAFEARRTNP